MQENEYQLKYINGYKILGQLGKGGFGTVFKVKKKNKIYALKCICLQGQNYMNLKYIKNEIKIMQGLVNSENIVKILDNFVFGNKQCILMEYCNQGNLLQYALKNQPNETQCMQIFIQILCGFKSIHEKQYLHRDLKPENILINNSVFKICDFGLASVSHIGKTYCGTNAYMAPEVLLGKQYDYKVDLWNLGVVLYVILYRKTPFKSYVDMHQQCTPYFDLQYQLKNKGYKKKVNKEIAQIFRRIFIINPAQRATFSEIHNYFQNLKNLFKDQEILKLQNAVQDYKDIEKKETKKPIQIYPSRNYDSFTFSEKTDQFDTELQIKSIYNGINSDNDNNIEENNQKKRIREKCVTQHMDQELNKIDIEDTLIEDIEQEGELFSPLSLRFHQNNYTEIEINEVKQTNNKSININKSRKIGPKCQGKTKLINKYESIGQQKSELIFDLNKNKIYQNDNDILSHVQEADKISSSSNFCKNIEYFSEFVKVDEMLIQDSYSSDSNEEYYEDSNENQQDIFENIQEEDDDQFDQEIQQSQYNQNQNNAQQQNQQILNNQSQSSSSQQYGKKSTQNSQNKCSTLNFKKDYKSNTKSTLKTLKAQKTMQQKERIMLSQKYSRYISIFQYYISKYQLIGKLLDFQFEIQSSIPDNIHCIINYVVIKNLIFFAYEVRQMIMNKQNLLDYTQEQLNEFYNSNISNKLVHEIIEQDLEIWNQKLLKFYFKIQNYLDNEEINMDLEIINFISVQVTELSYDNELKLPTRKLIDIIFKNQYKLGIQLFQKLEVLNNSQKNNQKKRKSIDKNNLSECNKLQNSCLKYFRNSLSMIIIMVINHIFEDKHHEFIFFHFYEYLKKNNSNQEKINNQQMEIIIEQKKIQIQNFEFNYEKFYQWIQTNNDPYQIIDTIHRIMKTAFGEKALDQFILTNNNNNNKIDKQDKI